MTKHPCPNCGEMTSGTWTEGGLLWAICEICADLGSGPRKEVKDNDRKKD